MKPIEPAFVGIPGGPELPIVLLLAVLLFGASKLPEFARSMGAAHGEFLTDRAALERELAEPSGESTEQPSVETLEHADR